MTHYVIFTEEEIQKLARHEEVKCVINNENFAFVDRQGYKEIRSKDKEES